VEKAKNLFHDQVCIFLVRVTDGANITVRDVGLENRMNAEHIIHQLAVVRCPIREHFNRG
jgi:hypothetical protein